MRPSLKMPLAAPGIVTTRKSIPLFPNTPVWVVVWPLPHWEPWQYVRFGKKNKKEKEIQPYGLGRRTCPRLPTSKWQSQHLVQGLALELDYFLPACFSSSHMIVTLNFTILFFPSHQLPPKEQIWLVCSYRANNKTKDRIFMCKKINIYKTYLLFYP